MSRSAPGRLVVAAAVLDADRLGHGDLHVVDVAAVPDRLEDAVGEPEHQEVLDGLLPEVVIDPVDLVLAEHRRQIWRLSAARRVEVVAERLLDDDAPPARRCSRARAATRAEAGARCRRRSPAASPGRRGRCPACRWRSSPVERLVQPVVERRILERRRARSGAAARSHPRSAVSSGGARELARLVAQLRAELGLGVGSDRGDADDRERRPAGGPAAAQVVERRHQLALGEVAGRAEDHHRAGIGRSAPGGALRPSNRPSLMPAGLPRALDVAAELLRASPRAACSAKV